MAAIPAANVSLVHRGTDGPKFVLIYQITGDASGTTFVAAMRHIVAHAVGNVSEAAGYNPQVTYTNAAGGATVTYGAAPGSTNKHFITLWGY